MTGLPLISDAIRAEAQNHLGYAHPQLKVWVNTYPITIRKKYYYSLTLDAHKLYSKAY